MPLVFITVIIYLFITDVLQISDHSPMIQSTNHVAVEQCLKYISYNSHQKVLYDHGDFDWMIDGLVTETSASLESEQESESTPNILYHVYSAKLDCL